MKLLIMLALAVLPLLAMADDTPAAPKIYKECVQWTTYNGMATSKQFHFVASADQSVLLVMSYFENTAKCEGSARFIDNYDKIKVTNSRGDDVVRFIDAQDDASKVYYQIMLSPNYVTIYSGDTLPVQHGLDNLIYLKRAN